MSDKAVLLETWGRAHFDPPPSLYTLRSMARMGKIQPAPVKVGKHFYVRPEAKFVKEGPPPEPGYAETFAAVVEEQKRREKITHLYRHFDATGALLYVGISLSPVARLRQHAGASHWACDIAKVEIEAHPSRQDALLAEEAAIKSERPLHNIVHAKRQKARKSKARA